MGIRVGGGMDKGKRRGQGRRCFCKSWVWCLISCYGERGGLQGQRGQVRRESK